MLATYAPGIFIDAQDKMQKLLQRHPDLEWNFPNSIYSCATVHPSKKTVTYEHVDTANAPINWCHIVPLGCFDPKVGGHLILFDLGLVIEFPPGSSILIPSAVLRHGNTSIRPHEERMSFTQYCSGGLMRWVECGFRTYKQYQEEDPVGFAKFKGDLKDRTTRYLNLFSRINRASA